MAAIAVNDCGQGSRWGVLGARGPGRPSKGSGLPQCVFVARHRCASVNVVGLGIQRHWGAVFLLLDPGLHETAKLLHGSG